MYKVIFTDWNAIPIETRRIAVASTHEEAIAIARKEWQKLSWESSSCDLDIIHPDRHEENVYHQS